MVCQKSTHSPPHTWISETQRSRSCWNTRETNRPVCGLSHDRHEMWAELIFDISKHFVKFEKANPVALNLFPTPTSNLTRNVPVNNVWGTTHWDQQWKQIIAPWSSKWFDFGCSQFGCFVVKILAILLNIQNLGTHFLELFDLFHININISTKIITQYPVLNFLSIMTFPPHLSPHLNSVENFSKFKNQMLPHKPPYNTTFHPDTCLQTYFTKKGTFWDMDPFQYSNPIFPYLQIWTFWPEESWISNFLKSFPVHFPQPKLKQRSPKGSKIDPHLDQKTGVHIIFGGCFLNVLWFQLLSFQLQIQKGPFNGATSLNHLERTHMKSLKLGCNGLATFHNQDQQTPARFECRAMYSKHDHEISPLTSSSKPFYKDSFHQMLPLQIDQKPGGGFVLFLVSTCPDRCYVVSKCLFYETCSIHHLGYLLHLSRTVVEYWLLVRQVVFW